MEDRIEISQEDIQYMIEECASRIIEEGFKDTMSNFGNKIVNGINKAANFYNRMDTAFEKGMNGELINNPQTAKVNDPNTIISNMIKNGVRPYVARQRIQTYLRYAEFMTKYGIVNNDQFIKNMNVYNQSLQNSNIPNTQNENKIYVTRDDIKDMIFEEINEGMLGTIGKGINNVRNALGNVYNATAGAYNSQFTDNRFGNGLAAQAGEINKYGVENKVNNLDDAIKWVSQSGMTSDQILKAKAGDGSNFGNLLQTNPQLAKDIINMINKAKQ